MKGIRYKERIFFSAIPVSIAVMHHRYPKLKDAEKILFIYLLNEINAYLVQQNKPLIVTQSLSFIGNALGKSPAAIHRALKLLEDEGLINVVSVPKSGTRITINFESDFFNQNINVSVALKLKPPKKLKKSLQPIEQSLQPIEQIIQPIEQSLQPIEESIQPIDTTYVCINNKELKIRDENEESDEVFTSRIMKQYEAERNKFKGLKWKTFLAGSLSKEDRERVASLTLSASQ